jgi:ABC-2 type transport system permease protein
VYELPDASQVLLVTVKLFALFAFRGAAVAGPDGVEEDEMLLLLLIPAALAVLLLFVVAVGFATSALNVRYRDTGHLIELVVLAWFWSTPIVYPASLVQENLEGAFSLYLLNPMANIVLAFQRGIYGGVSQAARESLPALGLTWYGVRLLVVGAVSVVLLYFTWRLFFRRSGDFAEEL